MPAFIVMKDLHERTWRPEERASFTLRPAAAIEKATKEPRFTFLAFHNHPFVVVLFEKSFHVTMTPCGDYVVIIRRPNELLLFHRLHNFPADAINLIVDLLLVESIDRHSQTDPCRLIALSSISFSV